MGDVGKTLISAVCWPVYGAITKAANGDWAGAAGDFFCPVGINRGVEAIQCWQAGKVVEGIADVLLPGTVPGASPSVILDKTGFSNFLTCQANGQNDVTPNITPIPQIEEQLNKDDGTETARDSRNIAATEDDVTRRAAYLSARNAGANRAAASAMAGAQTDPTNQAAALSAAKNAGSYTQNDWLEKMGYANALSQQAANKKNGAFLDTIGAIFSGAGAGAGMGASLGGGGGK